MTTPTVPQNHGFTLKTAINRKTELAAVFLWL